MIVAQDSGVKTATKRAPNTEKSFFYAKKETLASFVLFHNKKMIIFVAELAYES